MNISDCSKPESAKCPHLWKLVEGNEFSNTAIDKKDLPGSKRVLRLDALLDSCNSGII